MSLINLGNENLPSVIADPFGKSKIIAIHIHYMKTFDERFNASGTIKFKNGNTQGQQDFTGKDVEEIIIKMKAVIQELEK